MNGMIVILKKELSDHFTSYRFLILFALIAMVSMITAYMAGLNMAKNLESMAKPKFIFMLMFTSSGAGFSLVDFVSIFGPLIGIILGFDTINRERNEGTLSKLLSQPIYRDAVVNGKFLAGFVLIAIMMTAILLVVSALGLIILGIVPGVEEMWRIFIYLLISIFYIGFWLGLAILFSILFRSVATSALASIAAWVFLSFFLSLGANAVANALTPDAGESNPESYLRRANIEKAISLASPLNLYSDATITVIDPMKKTTRSVVQVGMMEQISMARFSGPLPLSQSILIVMPYIISMVAITILCFGISYTVFMRQEIRSV
ncbi:MAG: ABC transporter permease subunit [Deltaproteobacteria bacterium]|jgi:ABC-2 type transport system permease protein